MTRSVDVAIVGGGHNALTAAAYLASAGKSVVVLERLPTFGGAAVSAEAFPGVSARLSRYSYLVSLLPQRVIRDLGLDIQLARRRYSSYTPLPGSDTGLLVDTGDPVGTAASFAAIGAGSDAAAWGSFYDATSRLAGALFPTVTEPLPTRSEARLATYTFRPAGSIAIACGPSPASTVFTHVSAPECGSMRNAATEAPLALAA